MQILLRWVITAASLYATIWLLHLFDLAKSRAGHWYDWFIAVVVMALVNAIIRPVVSFFAAPLNCLTFGLVGVVINAVMFWLVPVFCDALGIPTFRLNPLGALIGSILVGLIGGLLNHLIIPPDRD